MRLFVNENAVKAKASGALPRTPLRELSALTQIPLKLMYLGIIRAGYSNLYEQFLHKRYSLKNFS